MTAVSTIYIVNESSGCTSSVVTQSITTNSCDGFILRINPNVTERGPFNVVVITGANIQEYSGVTYNELYNGYPLVVNCP